LSTCISWDRDGIHSSDIPWMVAQAATRHAGASYRITEPLGLDAKIGHLILERVQQSIGRKQKTSD
jgi:sirohydrochlorin ferrochelatase